MNSIRIATWNLERPRQNGWIKNERRLEQIRKIDADLWILTETNTAIDLGSDYTAVTSRILDGDENLTTIWSRWPVLNCILTLDPVYAVCAEVDSPLGAMIVYGTIITYANDRGINGNSKRWHEHRRSIIQHHQDWLRIQQQYPNHLMCIAGDFNQSRDRSGWYEEAKSVELLTVALDKLSLKCVTEENFREQGLSRSTVDHICLSQGLDSAEAVAWEGKTEAGRMSDHNGVYVDLRL